jgi:outer membrane immunogenic protein
MKKLLTVLALSTLTVSAFAADLPRRAMPAKSVLAPAPVATWTGFYAGANLGWNASSNTSPSLSGPTAGFQVGYDYQFDQFVVGAAADLSWSNSRGSNAALSIRQTYESAVRARLGYVVSPSLLAYFTAGYGFGNFKVNDYVLATTAEQSFSRPVFGFGAEYKMDRNWAVFGEYRLQAAKVTGTNFNQNDFRVGVNYRF